MNKELLEALNILEKRIISAKIPCWRRSRILFLQRARIILARQTTSR